MTITPLDSGDTVAMAIAESGLSIYSPIDRQSRLFFDIAVLEEHLRSRLEGLSLAYPIRTRAKYSKSAVCQAMGYPIPRSFKRTQPRFPGQDLDVYVQKANNLQIWNEVVSPTRRYAIIRLNATDQVTNVRVVTGETIARLDRTGTLTKKYQAKRRADRAGSKLVSEQDTLRFIGLLNPVVALSASALSEMSPTARPEKGQLLTIQTLYHRLTEMIGQHLEDAGHDQERLRGEALHRLVCRTLGMGTYAETGQFPDILCQVLEVKLQTSPTIDLGLVSPDGEEVAEEVGSGIRHCDARYAVVYAERISSTILRITDIVVATGEDFFSEFQRFEGNVRNAKLQIPLPSDFFRETKRGPDPVVELSFNGQASG